MSRNLFLLVPGVLAVGIITWWFGTQIPVWRQIEATRKSLLELEASLAKNEQL